MKHARIINLPKNPKHMIEEAADKYVKADIKKTPLYWLFHDTFIAGAKWQAERIYSEEDVDALVYKIIDRFTDWSHSYTYKDKLIEIFNNEKKNILR
jgi:hypothetical protein